MCYLLGAWSPWVRGQGDALFSGRNSIEGVHSHVTYKPFVIH